MGYTKVNIEALEDQAPRFGIESQEARSMRRELGAERIGLSHYRVRPGKRLEFGHRHRSMDEAYVILSGGGTFRVDDETFDVAASDVVRVEPGSWRGWEAGDDGMVVLAVGEHVEGDDETEMDMGWWSRG
jgi:uncharacterized cupin superfamily protein